MASEDDSHDLTQRRATAQEPLGASLQERLAAQGADPRMPFPKPRKKRSDGRGGGARRSVSDVRKDIEAVAKHLADGKPRWWIVEHYGKRKVPASTVDRWIAAVRERMQADLVDELPTLREKLLGQLRRERKACIDSGDQTNARQYFKLEVELLGLAAPEKHDVRAVVAQMAAPAEVDPGELLRAEGVSDEQLRIIGEVARGLTAKRAGVPVGLIGDTTVGDGRSSD